MRRYEPVAIICGVGVLVGVLLINRFVSNQAVAFVMFAALLGLGWLIVLASRRLKRSRRI